MLTLEGRKEQVEADTGVRAVRAEDTGMAGAEERKDANRERVRVRKIKLHKTLICSSMAALEAC